MESVPARPSLRLAVLVSLMQLAQACPCRLASGVELLEQPGHVLAEGLHGAEGFFVLLDLAFVAAEADVPVTGAGDDHLADQEELVDRVEVLEALAAGDTAVDRLTCPTGPVIIVDDSWEEPHGGSARGDPHNKPSQTAGWTSGKEELRMKYRVLIEQDEDGVFVAEVPSLPGCISQGKTRSEALKNIKEAIAGYLESLDAHNEPVPPPISEEIVEVSA